MIKMSQLEMIQSYARRNGLTAKQYGKCVTVFNESVKGGGFRRHVVMNGEDSYTIVFQYETILDKGVAERAWEQLREYFTDVSMTFGEVTGMWRNTKERLRLYIDMSAHEGDTEIFDERFSNCVGTLFNVQDLLLRKYHEFKDGATIEFEEKPWDGYVSPMDVKNFFNEERSGGFADVAGMEALKSRLMDEVVWPLTNRVKAARYRITPPNGMLLYGPPGCGKTFFAQKFAEETGFSFKMLHPSDIGGVFIHQTQGKVAELFEEARNEAPCIICFDEIDAMVPRRTSTPGIEYQNTEVNEFLVQMNNCGEKGIFVIGTTNNRDLVDPAALRTGRLDYHVEIPLPGREQREQLFRVSLKGRPVEENVDCGALAEVTDGITASDIAFVVNKAALAAARSDVKISSKILTEALAQVCYERTPQCDTPSEQGEEHDLVDVRIQIPKKTIVS